MKGEDAMSIKVIVEFQAKPGKRVELIVRKIKIPRRNTNPDK
jgi:hypothetical protein